MTREIAPAEAHRLARAEARWLAGARERLLRRPARLAPPVGPTPEERDR